MKDGVVHNGQAMSEQSANTRGRPQSVNPDVVARIALDLFIERGFESVTMAEVAEAAGIGRRTLFRYFPSKLALVWGGADEANQLIEDALHTEDHPERSTAEVLVAAYRAGFRVIEANPELTRERLLIIDRYPEVYAYGHQQWTAGRDRIAEFIAHREGAAIDSLPVQTRALLSSTLTFGALVWWAQHPQLDFATTIDEALADLERRLAV